VLDCPPEITGVLHFGDWGEADRESLRSHGLTVLGDFDHDLERIVEGGAGFDFAIVSLPSVMSDAVIRVRTQLRRLGIPDRFIATLEDQIKGIGPRTVFEVDPVDLIGRKSHSIDKESIRRAVTGKRVLITGAGGSIGSELAMTVSEYEPAELFLMERSENALFEIDRRIARRFPGLTRGTWLHDVTEIDKTLAYCEAAKPEVVFHSAAHKHVPMMEDHPTAAIRNNFFGTMAIADAAAQNGCERFVMISTDKAVNPSSVMGATKRLAELYVQYMNTVSDTRFCMVRFGNVLGSSGSVLPTWSDQIRDGGPVTVTDARMTRYFMTIPEAARLVIQAGSLDEDVLGGEVFLLDMGEPINILQLVERFIAAHGLEPCVVGAGELDRDGGAGWMPIVLTGARPGEKLVEKLAYEAECMVPTAHPGIHIWKMNPPSPERVADMVATLAEACQRRSAETALTALHRLLPEMEVPVAGTTSVSVPVGGTRRKESLVSAVRVA